MKQHDLIIIGGGIAGLTAAIHISKQGYSVLLIEKHSYPHHKVCGEYVSNEIMPYLNCLGISPDVLNALSINKLQLSTQNGKSIFTSLPLGGFGISRYAFDKLLYDHAVKAGSRFVFDTVTDVYLENERFTIRTTHQEFKAKLVIGAYGKRANLDKKLKREFIYKKSYWLGVKAHYQLNDFPDDLVALHNFNGGYAGLSKTETGAVNFCYLTSYKSFNPYNDIENFNAGVVSKNPFLRSFLQNATPLFQKPLTIAQINFDPKKPVEKHILMCGDTAGLIHPLCGNGMAMAVHSAKIASELIHKYFSGILKDRKDLEAEYTKSWNSAFRQRLWIGRKLQTLLLSPRLSDYTMTLANKVPFLLGRIISLTHGKPISC